MIKTWGPVCGVMLAASGVALAQVSTGHGDASRRDPASHAAVDTPVQSSEAPRQARLRPSVAPGTELQATLTKAVDARHVNTGDEVSATLEQDVQGDGRVVLPRGTRLVGHVTEVRARGKRPDSVPATNDSRLGLVFDKAVFDDGRQVPVVATIQALASSEAAAADGARGEDSARGSNVGSGRVASGGAAAGLKERLPGTTGGVLGGAGSEGADSAEPPRSAPGASTRASTGAAGGITPGGRLLSGSRGVFGINNIDIDFAGSGRAGVLVSHVANVELPRGALMLLISG
jgi:hypothetical protein